jgi:hypothetical protein
MPPTNISWLDEFLGKTSFLLFSLLIDKSALLVVEKKTFIW